MQKFRIQDSRFTYILHPASCILHLYISVCKTTVMNNIHYLQNQLNKAQTIFL